MRTALIVLGLALGSAFSMSAHAADSKPVQPASAQSAAYSTEDTALGDILDDPEAAAIIDKYVAGFSKNPEVEMARSMTLRQIQQYAMDTFTDQVLSSIDADFVALASKRKAK